MPSDPLPQWIEDYAQEIRTLFDLDVWQIVVKLSDSPGNDRANEGHASVDVRYLTARIELNPAFSEERMRATLMHEMLHVAFAPIAQAHLRVPALVPKGQRKHARTLLDDGLEQTIERLTRALQKAIKPSERQEQHDAA